MNAVKKSSAKPSPQRKQARAKSKPTSSRKPLTEEMKKKMRTARVSGVLITGASNGIGYAFAEHYAQLDMQGNYKVILVSRNAKRLSAAEKRLKEKFPRAQILSFATDLSHPQAGAKVWDFCRKKKVRVGTLINNAGFGYVGPFSNVSEKTQREMMGVNVHAVVDLSRNFLYEMRRTEDRGTLINVASITGLHGMAGFSLYAATKAFVLNFTEGLAEECRKMDVQALAVCPGLTQTDFLNVAASDEARAQIAEKRKRFPAIQPTDVVEATMRALSAEQRGMVIVDKWMSRVILASVKFLPRSVVIRLFSRFYKDLH